RRHCSSDACSATYPPLRAEPHWRFCHPALSPPLPSPFSPPRPPHTAAPSGPTGRLGRSVTAPQLTTSREQGRKLHTEFPRQRPPTSALGQNFSLGYFLSVRRSCAPTRVE